MKLISITCDPQKREMSIRRLEAFDRGRYIDRVPVQFGVEARMMLAARGVTFGEYFSSPKANLEHQLYNFKWRMEHVEDDFLGRQQVIVFPDFQNVTTAGLFDESSILWLDNDTPRIRHFITKVEDMKSIRPANPDANLWRRKREYLLAMRELAKDYTVQINGEPVQISVSMGWHETVVTGAYDMCGENLFYFMMDEPEETKSFLKIVNQSCIAYEKHMRELSGEQRDGADVIIDGGELVSVNLFREFFTPLINDYFAAFPGSRRYAHNCGNCTHLLAELRDGVHLNQFGGFGYAVDPAQIAQIFGRSLKCWGGINPMLLRDPHSDVEQEVLKYIQMLAPYRNYMLCDGYNLAPDTPVERLNSIVRFCDKIGLPEEKQGDGDDEFARTHARWIEQ